MSEKKPWADEHPQVVAAEIVDVVVGQGANAIGAAAQVTDILDGHTDAERVRVLRYALVGVSRLATMRPGGTGLLPMETQSVSEALSQADMGVDA